MTLKTKSIYDREQKDDGERWLVTRYYPRGVKKERFDRWVKELSPSRELLREYRSGAKSWDRFRSDFIAELRSSPASLAAIRTLRKESEHRDITILCYERAGKPCHRYIVEELVKRSHMRKRAATVDVTSSAAASSSSDP